MLVIGYCINADWHYKANNNNNNQKLKHHKQLIKAMINRMNEFEDWKSNKNTARGSKWIGSSEIRNRLSIDSIFGVFLCQ